MYWWGTGPRAVSGSWELRAEDGESSGIGQEEGLRGD